MSEGSEAGDDQKSPKEVWEENSRGFRYDGPDGHPETWSSEEFTEIHDRVIGRRVEWICQKCSQPFRSVKKARSHVERQHGEHLYQKFGDVDE